MSTVKIKKTFKATIHIGLQVRNTGEVFSSDFARKICQDYVDEKRDCISFTETEYIYTGGREPGCIIEFIQYPRFPREEDEIVNRALELAEKLMTNLNQFKVSVICPDVTYMLQNNLGEDKI